MIICKLFAIGAILKKVITSTKNISIKFVLRHYIYNKKDCLKFSDSFSFSFIMCAGGNPRRILISRCMQGAYGENGTYVRGNALLFIFSPAVDGG